VQVSCDSRHGRPLATIHVKRALTSASRRL
jgi:hypothetical protein